MSATDLAHDDDDTDDDDDHDDDDGGGDLHVTLNCPSKGLKNGREL